MHIPFCVRKCAYCDFLSFPAPEQMHREYVEQLIQEIYGQSGCFQDCRVTSIFLGGGTPSILSADLMAQIFLALWESFDISQDAEITIEANPGTLTMEKLEVYRQCGINRLSLGLQSSDSRELKCLGRIHTYEDFLKSYQRARQVGFANINVDLMSALPGQTMATWKNTLRKVMMLKPEHISAYSLIIEEGTPFYERYGGHARSGAASKPAAGRPEQPEADCQGQCEAGCLGLPQEDWPDIPDEETDRDMYHMTKELLAAHHYQRYEISNYAKPGYECRHNIGYWTGVDYLGLGLGASSYISGFRYHNTDDMQEYLSLDLSEPGTAAREIVQLTREEQMEEFMFLGLRMSQGVSGSDFYHRFGQNIWNVYGDVIARLESQGLVQVSMPRIRLTDVGVDVSNGVLCQFLLDHT